MPKVSVIVPVYNVEKYIGRCIESILKQTLKEWELILIDDSSRDNSLGVMRGYASKDDRIQILQLRENQGPMIARRKGDIIAAGEYITYCDSDDWLSINALEVLYNAAVCNNADIVIGQFKTVFDNGREIPFQIHNKLTYGDSRVALFKSILLREVHQGVAGKMFRREVVQQKEFTVYEHCTMSEDAAVLFQYADKSNKVCVVNDFTYYYYMRSDSSTHSNLTINQIEGMCKTSALRYNIVIQYPSLKNDINRYLAQNFVGLLPFGKQKVQNLLYSYKLNGIISTPNIFRYFSLKESIRLLIRRDILPYLYWIKNEVKK